MKLVLLGLNHRTAPVEVRERYAVPAAQLQGVDEKLGQESWCQEAALVSTCNRTELMAACSEVDEATDRLHRFFAHALGDGSAEPRQLYELRAEAAVRHVFRVAAGLDSMVLGEAQILGQLKQAYRAAVAAGSCGPLLNRLFHRAFRAAKRVRTETGLGGAPVSLARVGVQLAAEVFEAFGGKRVLLIGAGEMAESALHGLREAGVRDVVVVNRNQDAAQRLAVRFSGRAARLAALAEELSRADICLASAQVRQPLVGGDEVRGAMRGRQGRPLLLIDLGLPRNVDPEANRVDEVLLYDLDDLDRVASRGRALRREAVEPAELIVAAEAERYERWREALQVVPTIQELLEWAGRLARSESRRAAARLGVPGSGTERELERMALALVSKLLHRPLERLRTEAGEGYPTYYADAVREIFGLSEDDE